MRYITSRLIRLVGRINCDLIFYYLHICADVMSITIFG